MKQLYCAASYRKVNENKQISSVKQVQKVAVGICIPSRRIAQQFYCRRRLVSTGGTCSNDITIVGRRSDTYRWKCCTIISDHPIMSSNPAPMASSEPTWEACKENVLPIKRGRSAKGLNAALTTTSKDKDTLATTEQGHETALLEAAAGGDNVVVLEAYIRYFKWIRDTYPSSTDKALKLLEQCTCELKSDPTLRNDTRFVKMWIEYADMVRTPGEIFSFMQSNKIGETVALFWVVRCILFGPLSSFHVRLSLMLRFHYLIALFSLYFTPFPPPTPNLTQPSLYPIAESRSPLTSPLTLFPVIISLRHGHSWPKKLKTSS